MLRILLLLLALTVLQARPLYRLENGKFRKIGQKLMQDETQMNSALKHVNSAVNPMKHLAGPAEFCRQGTEPSRRFLMDLNTGLLKKHSNQINGVAGGKWEVVSEHEEIKSENEKPKSAPVDERRQGTEPSRRFVVDFTTGTIKEDISEMSRRVSGFYNPPAVEKRQGTEPSRRFLVDLNSGMIKQQLSEMNRRVSGFYNPGVTEERRGTQNSRATLVDPRTGQKLPILSELQRSAAPLDEFRQGTEHPPFILQQLRLSEMHKQKVDTDGSRSSLMELNTGRLRENQHSDRWQVVSEADEIENKDSSEDEWKHISAPVEERRQGTQPSRRFLMDLNTGMIKEDVSEMNRRVSGFYNPPAVETKQGTEPSRRVLIDPKTGMIKQHLSEMNRRVSGFYNPGVTEERRGTQNSRVTLVDPRTGQKLPILSELQRSAAPLDEFRQGTQYQPQILQELRNRALIKPLYESHRQRTHA